MTEEEVLEARELYKEGFPVAFIAERLGHPARNVRNAISGKTFRYLPNAQRVDSGKLNPAKIRQIKEEIAGIDYRGKVTHIMHKYDISYETYRRLRNML